MISHSNLLHITYILIDSCNAFYYGKTTHTKKHIHIYLDFIVIVKFKMLIYQIYIAHHLGY